MDVSSVLATREDFDRKRDMCLPWVSQKGKLGFATKLQVMMCFPWPDTDPLESSGTLTLEDVSLPQGTGGSGEPSCQTGHALLFLYGWNSTHFRMYYYLVIPGRVMQVS